MPTKQKNSKANLFSRINELSEAGTFPFSLGPNVFSIAEYAASLGLAQSTALLRLRTKLLPQGVVRRVRTKKNGKLVNAWEMVD